MLLIRTFGPKQWRLGPGLSIQLMYLQGLTVLKSVRQWVDRETCVSVPRRSSLLQALQVEQSPDSGVFALFLKKNCLLLK